MAARYLAFKFIHPDFDNDKQRSGLVLNKDNSLATVSGGSAIRQSIYLLLTTRMGERIMRPTYGSDLNSGTYDFQFQIILRDIKR